MTRPTLQLTTTLTRPDQHGDPAQFQAILYARVEHHIAGYPAAHDGPGCDDEYEFAMLGAEWDDEDADFLGAITDAELCTLLDWLMSDPGHEAACQAARDAMEDGGRDPGETRDRVFDEFASFVGSGA